MMAAYSCRDVYFFSTYLTSETKNFIMIVKPGHTELFRRFNSFLLELIAISGRWLCPHIRSVYHTSSSYSHEYAVVMKGLSHTQ